ncbi:sensor histidine kinase [Microvirga sp. 2MCAF38]|uniref:sensor histidine kinase n=1 Tax=Microvirga sp. 2MCAF38 TaxID=3232989 RepID=UPI003F99B6E3
MTLTRRLLVLALISVLPAIAIWTYTEVSLRRAREAEVNDIALRQAQIASLDLERIFEGVRSLLVAVEEVPAVLEFNTKECSAYLRSLQAEVSYLDALAVIDSDGRSRCVEGVPLDTNFKNQEFFKAAYESGTFQVGEYSRSFANGVTRAPAVLPLALALRNDDGGVIGVVVAALDLRWLSQQFGGRPMPPDSTITVTDRKGIILARQPKPQEFIGTLLGDPMLAFVGASQPGAFEAVGRDGTRRVYGYMPTTVAPEDTYVSVGLSSAVAFESINQAAERGFLLIAIALGLALSLSGLIGHFFVTKPFEKMIKAIHAWRHGDYDARVEFQRGSSEFTLLAKAFNDLMNDVAERQRELQASEERARLALEAGHMGTWWFDHRNKTGGWSAQAAALLGLPLDRTSTTIQEWQKLLHPADADAAVAKFRMAMTSNNQYQDEYRIRNASGEYRWFDSRGRTFVDANNVPVYSLGVFQDVTERKRAEEQQHLLLDELNHRVKNTLATVQSIASQTLRSSGDLEHFRGAFESRLLALSKTHDVLTRSAWRDADLREIADQELAPYRRKNDTRVSLQGPPVRLPTRMAINFGLVLHELVTNAVKYGALSNAQGRVSIVWSVAPDAEGRSMLTVHWQETEGPIVEQPKRHGFGSRLIQRSIRGELGGQVNMRFLPSGLICDLIIPVEDKVVPWDHRRATNLQSSAAGQES